MSLPQAVEDPEEGGLAGACVPHHQYVGALADLQIQVLHQQLVREGGLVGQSLQDEGRVYWAPMDVVTVSQAPQSENSSHRPSKCH